MKTLAEIIIIGAIPFLFDLVATLWRSFMTEFWIAIGVGICLAGATWWFASYVAFQYNRQFSMHTRHHVYCGIAAVVTLICTLLFFSLRFTENVAEALVSAWQHEIRMDSRWSDETYTKAYEAVYALKNAAGKQLENFTGKPHPRVGTASTTIPTAHDRSKQTAAQIYANEAVRHFKERSPFLSLILWPDSTEAEQSVIRDMELTFATGATSYSAGKAIDLVSAKVQHVLKEQVPRVVIVSRFVLIGFFLLVQAIVFGLLIWSALADIKVKPVSQRLED